MKSLVLYSSLTGNTKRLAEAIASALPEPTLCPIDEAPLAQDYDIIAIGYWVIRGLPDEKVLHYFTQLKQGRVLLFGTLGAYPDSPHALACIEKSEAMLRAQSPDIKLLGSYLCMGKVDPACIARSKHPMTPERQARLEEGNKHPNESDFEQARLFVIKALQENQV